MVRNFCEALNIPHTTLLWEGEKPKSRLQENARKERYRLLETFCLDQRIPYLLTAHHYDDQIETFFMRLFKGSGIKGLSGIDAKTKTHFGYLLRPFLHFSKKELVRFVQTNSIPYVNDPSNKNETFERVRIRSMLEDSVNKHHVSLTKIQKTLDHLYEASSFVQKETQAALAKIVTFSHFGFAQIDSHLFLSAPSLIQKEIIKAICFKIFPSDYPPQEKSIKQCMADIAQEKKCFSLKGTLFHYHRNSYLVTRDLRHAPEIAKIDPGSSFLFDNRIVITNKNLEPFYFGYGRNMSIPKEILEKTPLPSFLKPYLLYIFNNDQTIVLFDQFSY
jgi:tRNA(Ile)-lysidine synthase